MERILPFVVVTLLAGVPLGWSAAHAKRPRAPKQKEVLVEAPATSEFPAAFFKLLTEDKLEASRQCMRGVAFKTIVNGNDYYRVVDAMSRGYFYGTLLSFARNSCAADKSKNAKPFYTAIKKAVSAEKDSLSVMPSADTPDPLAHAYSILLSLGMIETDGAFNDGRDSSAWNIDELSAETGTYQVSYDTHRDDKNKIKYVPQDVYDYLMTKYKSGNRTPECLAEIFTLGQDLSKNTESWGFGKGFDFQEAIKKCPALAADYQVYLLRVTSKVNGPVIRKEAQPKPECVEILNSVKALLNPNSCRELEPFIAKFANHPGSKFYFKQDQIVPQELAVGSYTPHEIKEYTVPENYTDSSGVKKTRAPEELKRPLPEYFEIRWIDNTIRYFNIQRKFAVDAGDAATVAELDAKIGDLQTRKGLVSTDPKILARAVAKRDIDLEKIDVILAAMKEKLNVKDIKGAKLKERALAARQHAYDTILKSREGLQKSRDELAAKLPN